MSYSVCLVLGARSLLAEYAIRKRIREPLEARLVEGRAKEWLWTEMACLVGGDGRNVVVDGGAEGPDTWGHENAVAYDLVWSRYHADGRMEGGRGPSGDLHLRHAWRHAIRRATTWEEFRERNLKMLDEMEVLVKRDGAHPLVLALLDVASPTGGAAWTTGQAVDRGMGVSTWPG